MPIDYSKYPKSWKRISREIRERSGGQCECSGECGLHRTNPGPRRCIERNGQQAVWAKGKVVLTVAHLNHNTRDSRRSNLKAMCQRCHLRYDAKIHRLHARQTRERRTGQQRLFA